jgi:hypothetical protein
MKNRMKMKIWIKNCQWICLMKILLGGRPNDAGLVLRRLNQMLAVPLRRLNFLLDSSKLKLFIIPQDRSITKIRTKFGADRAVAGQLHSKYRSALGRHRKKF